MPAPRLAGLPFAAVAVAGALVLSAVPAAASQRSVEVRYGDLNLASEAGSAKLKQRVALAVKKVCGDADMRNLAERESVIRCRRETAARTDRDVALALEHARNGAQMASLTIEK